jgi:hypothetical protein
MDINVRAFRTVQEALKDQTTLEDSKKSASRRGGLAGGPARAASMSAEQRTEIAKKASNVRWKKHRAAR